MPKHVPRIPGGLSSGYVSPSFRSGAGLSGAFTPVSFHLTL